MAAHRFAREPEAEAATSAPCRTPKRHVLGDRHCRHGRVLQRLLRQPENLELVEMVPLRLEVLVVDQDLPELDRPLAGQRLDQFALAVA